MPTLLSPVHSPTLSPTLRRSVTQEEEEEEDGATLTLHDDDDTDTESEVEDNDDDESYQDQSKTPKQRGMSDRKRKESLRQLNTKVQRSLTQTLDTYGMPSQPSKKASSPKPTDEQRAAWKDSVITELKKGTREDDLFTIYLMSGCGSSSPFVSQMLTSYFVGKAVGADVYSLILPTEKSWDKFTLEKLIEGTKYGPWTVPQVPGMHLNIKDTCQQVYKTLSDKWAATKAHILAQDYHYNGIPCIDIPPCPSWQRFLQLVNKGRSWSWQLEWSHPDFFDRQPDTVLKVRKANMSFVVSHLMPIATIAEFKKKIKERVERGIKAHKRAFYAASNVPPSPPLRADADAGDAKKRKRKAKEDINIASTKGRGATNTTNAAAEAKKSAAAATNKKLAAATNKKLAADDVYKNNKKAIEERDAVVAKENATIAVEKLQEAITKERDATVAKKNATTAVAKLQEVILEMKMRDDKGIKPESIFRNPSVTMLCIRNLQEQVNSRDPTLGAILHHWKCYLLKSGDVRQDIAMWKYATALKGTTRSDLKELWMDHQAHWTPKTRSKFDMAVLAPPKRSSTEKGCRNYEKPSDWFIYMAEDAMQVMKVLMEACYLNKLPIIRYYWEYHLMKGLDQLRMDKLDAQKRLRGMLACLILSAATTDFEAINGAINLGKAGFLDTIDGLIEADVTVVEKCIKGCGIHRKRAGYLKEAFTIIKADHNGHVPCDFKGLESLPGVGRKTATLMLNEGFGFYAGIGTDKHVCHVSLGLGLYSRNGLRHAHPEHVEASLRTWIEQPNFKETNRIMGGTAQLVTQLLATLNTPAKEEDLHILLRCILHRFNSDREMELVWFIIAQLRSHYKVVNDKRIMLAKALKEEDEDEDKEIDELELDDNDHDGEESMAVAVEATITNDVDEECTGNEGDEDVLVATDPDSDATLSENENDETD
jgi:endonuclease III